MGTLEKIFDEQPPVAPQGCIAQAWTVAEVLRAWHILQPSPIKHPQKTTHTQYKIIVSPLKLSF
ncbi:MAG: hypothetical protein H0W49_04955 [Nitrospirales bacterium]|nr:hypothetical protein [Nitrospirales bacterium]